MISSVTGSGNTANQLSNAVGTDNNQLGKDSFLKLLVAQLANQTPTNPVDGTQFVAQLAQFSELEQLTQIGEQLTGLQSSQAGMISNQTVAFLGKEVTYPGDQVTHVEGEPTKISFRMGSGATDVDVVIKNQSGVEVARIPAGTAAGPQTINWSGLNNGVEAPSGNYTFTVEAVGKDGSPVQVQTFGRGRVDGISYQSGYPELLIGDQRLTPADIVEVTG